LAYKKQLLFLLLALLLTSTTGCALNLSGDDDDSADGDDIADDDDSADDDDIADDDDSADEPIDEDGDGHALSEDCNDSDAAIHPGATERCDHIDNDCDGAVDEAEAEDAPTWHQDADGDGYGLESETLQSCTHPHGYSAYAGDCNDDNPAYHPGASETDCTDPEDYNCDGVVDYADLDGDGEAACEDCNDDDSTVHTAASESCNSIDDNCDGQIDEAGATGETTWHLDADADSFGDANAPLMACAAPAGYVANSDDCDDLNPLISPLATEICDGQDNNCDTAVDDGSAAPGTFYADFDGDSYGNTSMAVVACIAPLNYLAASGDCDDLDATSYPGATEVCDGVDNNCDASIDEGVLLTFYGDFDGDGYGDPGTPLSSCTLPPGASANNLDCDDGIAGSNPAAIETCDGVDNNCDSTIDEGVTSVFYGDFDGDGFGDPGTVLNACTLPSGSSSNSLDCDDGQPTVYPGSAEVCDSLDNDCNGDVDDADANIDTSTFTTWHLDDDGDTFGDPSIATTACAPPNGYVADGSDCDDSDTNTNPATLWYADSDTDTYGDPNNSLAACTQPTGYLSDDQDCDDSDAGINPETHWYEDFDGDTYGNAAVELQSCTQPPGYVLDPTDCDDTNDTSGACIFDTVEFTTCNATGPTGPSAADCSTAYSNTALDQQVSVSSGIQQWVVPVSGNFIIEVAGAKGGNNTDHGNNGGNGASMQGTFALNQGQVIEIVVGQSGLNAGDSAGGGGGTFVVLQGASSPLIAAGGGGGGAENDDNSGNMTTYKNGITTDCAQGAPRHNGGTNPGGCSGSGGTNDPNTYGQGAGGGFLTDGQGSGDYNNGQAFVNGAAGGINGGFGGGGNGGGDGGGGGGGYSGGAGGSGGGSPDGPGGGGGSFNAGTNPSNQPGANGGGGYVIISAG